MTGVGVDQWQRAFRAWLEDGCPNPATGEMPAKRMPPAQVAFVLALSTYADARTGRNVRPGHGRVERIVGVSRSTGTRAVAWLYRTGWLTVESKAAGGRGGQSKVAVYRLAVPETCVTRDHRFPTNMRQNGPQTCVTGDHLPEQDQDMCSANPPPGFASTQLSDQQPMINRGDALAKTCVTDDDERLPA